MVRHMDSREREEEILGLLIESYIEESKPISSSYLCSRYKLPYSSATVRNALLSLENKGYLAHVHTSSGRVPTKAGFRYYAQQLDEERALKHCHVEIAPHHPPMEDMERAINYTLDMLSDMSGYTSIAALSHTQKHLPTDDRVYCRGTRYFLQQPEFTDIHKVRNLFYALEVEMNVLHLLLNKCFSERMKIMIGDDLGNQNMQDCSMVISGCEDGELPFSLGLLGPMRMDYEKAIASLYTAKKELKKVFEVFYER
jgi:transcriptional regulator of heat shock response